MWFNIFEVKLNMEYDSLWKILFEVLTRNGKTPDDYTSDWYNNYYDTLEPLLKGLYCTVNNNPDISQSEVNNNSTIEINVYNKCLIFALMCKENFKNDNEKIEFKRFLGKLRNSRLDMITDKEKVVFLERICKELLKENPPEDIETSEWENTVNSFYHHQLENIEISAKERDIKLKCNKIMEPFLNRLYNYNNGGSVVSPSSFVDNIFIENSIEKHLSVNIGNGNPWIELLDLDERLYLLDTFEKRIVEVMTSWENEVVNALIKKQNDTSLSIENLI